jgi:hypothetical protein
VDSPELPIRSIINMGSIAQSEQKVAIVTGATVRETSGMQSALFN